MARAAIQSTIDMHDLFAYEPMQLRSWLEAELSSAQRELGVAMAVEFQNALTECCRELLDDTREGPLAVGRVLHELLYGVPTTPAQTAEPETEP